MLLDTYPILASGSRRRARLEEALQVVSQGVAAGAIRNVELNDAKATLGRAAGDAWRQHVAIPHFSRGMRPSVIDPERDLFDTVMILSLHDVLATAKRVERSTAAGPGIDAMRAFVAELLPLAQQVAGLKDKVVKGRAPSATPKVENPDKVVRTCACCFRGIAVDGPDRMAHHGYRRPGQGEQTPSCSGIQFPCLEVSSAGLQMLVSDAEARYAIAQRAWTKRSEVNELTHTTRRGGQRVEETIRRGDPQWGQHQHAFFQRLEATKSMAQMHRDALVQKLAAWVQTEVSPGVAVTPIAADREEDTVDVAEAMRP